ncbi:MAG: M24 family metallopeptidase [Hyphomicrobiales bacterium]
MAVLTPFDKAEFERRLARLQERMAEEKLDAVLISTLAAFRYFSGYNPIISESPARPWFLVLPAQGEPVAAIPQLGADDMETASWIESIRHWPSPRPDDEGVSLLAETIDELPAHHGRVGAELGPETRLGMPAKDFEKLTQGCSSTFADASEIIRQVRAIKSPAEVARIRQAGACAGAAFSTVPSWLHAGMSEAEIHRRFQAELLTAGVDYVRYLAIGTGHCGYDSICRGPLVRKVAEGDVVGLDTGATIDGYFCDFDRNFSLGAPADQVSRAYHTLHNAVEAGIAAVKPDVTCAVVWQAMMQVLTDAGAEAGSIGRMGHGLGMALTEQPSIHPDDKTVLQAGMVLAIEPGLSYEHDGAPRLMVHEENVMVTGDGAELLSPRAAPEIVAIG